MNMAAIMDWFNFTANVSSQYLVPKDGTPLGGLIQDNVIAGVKLSLRGRFFNREDYQHLVFAGLGHVQSDLILLPPAIMKPKRLWSGKQVRFTRIRYFAAPNRKLFFRFSQLFC